MMISESIRHCSNRSHDEEEGRAGSMLRVTWDGFPALSGEALQEKAAREGFCVCGSLNLLDNESGLRIPTCTACGIDNRGESLSDTAASSPRRLLTWPVRTRVVWLITKLF